VAEIVAADRDFETLQAYAQGGQYAPKVRCEYVDADDPESISRLMQPAPDVVIDLLPTHFRGSVAAAAVNHGVHVVNTSFVGPEVRDLADEAKARQVTILPEFGLDPGIDLVLLGQAVRSLDRVEEIISYGSGIPEPEAAHNPLKYRVTWTFEGVLRSYRRAARVIRDGEIIQIADHQLFDPENIHQIEIEGLGRLEAYPNGDMLPYADLLGVEKSGLRNMGRYTLRWPGHCAFWKSMVDLHLLDHEPAMVDGVPVDRTRFLAAAIGPHIQLGAQQRDMVLVRVEVTGTKDGEKKRAVFQVIDQRDLETGFTAMSRSVGFMASIGAMMIGGAEINKRGLLSPITDIPYLRLARELTERGIRITSELTAGG
jgi:saccharopine dehydrogenase-like NADP-dependent oxidoreductase